MVYCCFCVRRVLCCQQHTRRRGDARRLLLSLCNTPAHMYARIHLCPCLRVTDTYTNAYTSMHECCNLNSSFTHPHTDTCSCAAGSQKPHSVHACAYAGLEDQDATDFPAGGSRLRVYCISARIYGTCAPHDTAMPHTCAAAALSRVMAAWFHGHFMGIS